jgi:hypothetical protein
MRGLFSGCSMAAQNRGRLWSRRIVAIFFIMISRKNRVRDQSTSIAGERMAHG